MQQRQQKTRVHDRRLYAQHLQSRYQPVRDCAHRTVTHQLRILHTNFVDDPQTEDQLTILCLSVRFGDFLGNPTHSFRKCRRCVARKITVCDSPRAWTTREWMGGSVGSLGLVVSHRGLCLGLRLVRHCLTTLACRSTATRTPLVLPRLLSFLCCS